MKLLKNLFLNITWIYFFRENLPETICSVCYHSFNASYDFFTKIKISQVVLTNIIASSLKHDACDEEALVHIYEDASTTFKEELCTIDAELSDLVEKCEENASLTDFSAENHYQSASITPIPEYVHDIQSDAYWKVYPWICGQCNVKFDNINLLRDHSKESHEICISLRCADCGANVNNFNEFVDHDRWHRESLRLYCPHCNMKLEDATHYSIHTSQPNCSACGELFTNKSAFNRHIRRYQKASKKPKEPKNKMPVNALLCKNIESWSDYPWMCRYCGTKVSDQHLLRSHLREVHSACFRIQCVDCQEKTQSFGAFVDHVREHMSSLKFYCQYCNYKLTTPDQNVVHINKYHSDPQCDICGEFFKEISELEGHKAVYDPPKRKEKPLKKPGPLDLTRRVCHKVVTSINSRHADEKLHKDRQRNFICDRCGKSFFTKVDFNAHNLVHANLEPQICKICKKSFLTKARLKKHVYSHYGDKQFQCNECQKCFRLKGTLVRHMIMHTDLLPFVCQYCDKRFRFRSVQKNHEVTHTGARPYTCDVCQMDFTCWSNCNKHMKRRHGRTITKN